MKKKSFMRVMALAMAAAMALAGCGNGSQDAEGASSGNEIKDLVISKKSDRELETFNILYSQRNQDFENLTNLWDGLLEVTPDGKLAPCIADEWKTEDGGKTWTFHIRDGVKWVDMNGNIKADCDAYDFATGLEWILNYYKNDASNKSMAENTIEGAAEYFTYTQNLSEEEALALKADEGSKFFEMVGIKVVDANTLEYTCLAAMPYFETLAAYVTLYPISQSLIDELGVAGVKAMDNENMWYNGAYTMTHFEHGNEKIFTKNPNYWDTECTRFDTATYKMVESSDVAFQLYDTGEIDYVDLTEANVKTITGDKNHKYYNYVIPDVEDKYSYQIHFNYQQLDSSGKPVENWNKAVANEAFRQSIYYAVDFGDYYRRFNLLDPYACQNNAYTMNGLVYTTDGTDYVDLVRENMGLEPNNTENMVRLDVEKGLALKAQAIEELTAIGVTFPVQMDYWIKAGNQTAGDDALVFKKCIETALGSDFINVNIKEFVSSLSKEVRTPQLASVYTNGWGADFGDPVNYVGQEILNPTSAYYSKVYSNIVKVEENEYNKDLMATYREFTRLVEEAADITDDIDARYEAFAESEAYMLEHALVVPLNYKKILALGKIDNSSRMNARFGCCNDKMKNWKTNDAGYTTEEAKANAAALKG